MLVERGMYFEHLTAPGHGITLMSHYPATRDSADWLETILDGGHNGTCLVIPDTDQEWIRLDGLVIQNGAGTEMAGGIFGIEESCLVLAHVLFRGHTVTGQSPSASAPVLRLRAAFKRLTIRNCLIQNSAVGTGRNVHAETDLSCRIDSLQMDGTGDHGCAGSFRCTDSMWVKDVLLHGYRTPTFQNQFGGVSYNHIDGIETRDMASDYPPILILGSGRGVVKNVYFHDNICTGNGPVSMLQIHGQGVHIDSVRVIGNSTAGYDVVELECPRDELANIYTGTIEHLLVEGNHAGGPNQPGNLLGGRIASIKNCNLLSSKITGNVSEMPTPLDSLDFWNMHSGAALYVHHDGLDTLTIESVEVSHNVVIDHANYWAIVADFGPDDFGPNHEGRALYLLLGDTRQAIVHNCIFHDNRLSAVIPETNQSFSLGSTVRIEGGIENIPWRTRLLVENCSFTDNDEGCLQIFGHSRSEVRNCVIRGPHRYGLWLDSDIGLVENVLIDSVQARDFANTWLPSHQAAVVFYSSYDSPQQTEVRNLTITNSGVRNLLVGDIADYPQSIVRNSLIANNSFQHLEAHWGIIPNDQPIEFLSCSLPVAPTAGEGNIIGMDPGFDPELGYPFLARTSVCIDSGDSSMAFDDLEDPDNPGVALWPSQGGLRNDIGYTGGPRAGTLDHLVAVRAPLKEPRAHPIGFELRPAFPNPFNPMTTIELIVPDARPFSLHVYNLQGQRVRTLLSGSQTPGTLRIALYGSDLASGVYFLSLEGNGFRDARKIVLLR
ncbi:MAG: right-handed parallel beta-helix repeat-containing protein [Calditrichaeota bacterium]|nr:right-handed parallel beta-helix repeat-containing protein [Calditrichota bacterium]